MTCRHCSDQDFVIQWMVGERCWNCDAVYVTPPPIELEVATTSYMATAGPWSWIAGLHGWVPT